MGLLKTRVLCWFPSMLLGTCCGALLTSSVSAAEDQAEPPDAAEIAKLMEEFGRLAPQHKELKDLVGRLVDVPEETAALFADWPKSLSTKKTKNLDFILAFVASASDIQRQATRCVKMIKPDSLLWFAYPKRSSGIETDITRDHGWEPLEALGYRPVRQIAIDATWSAVRFREKSLVKKK